MITIVTIICVVLGLATALVAGIAAYLDRAVPKVGLVLAGLTELAVFVYLGVRIADLANGHRTSGLAIVILYLIGLVAALPITVALSLFERSRWGSVILVAGALVVCVLFARINELWTVHG